MPEYKAWKSMKSRCYSPSTANSGHYRDNAIEVCEDWLHSFENFFSDMGNMSEGQTLDRIDNSKGYCKDNCRWVDRKIQAQNRGDFNNVFEHNGESHVLKEWAEIFDIKYTTLYQRIYRSGLSFQEAISNKTLKKQYEINGVSHSLKEWCNIYNVDFKMVNDRVVGKKWEILDALTIPKGARRTKTKI